MYFIFVHILILYMRNEYFFVCILLFIVVILWGTNEYIDSS